nr:GNAT family N-acetyltransferase [Micromonospora sp. DSM 115978]
MTVDTPAPRISVSTRENHRAQLADLLDRDVADLPDSAHLVDDLALDSLAMMGVLGWLDDQGLSIHIGRDLPATVGDALTLLQKATFPGLSVHLVRGADTPGAGPDATAPGATAFPVGGRQPVDPLVPALGDDTVKLGAIEPDDINFLYALAIRPETCFRWRYRGAPPSFERFVDDLWRQVLVQFVARRATDNQPVGHVVAYGADPAMRYLYIGTVFQPQYAGSGLAARAVAAFVRYLFHTFPLRKIYLEVPGYNWAQISSGQGRIFHVEGVLRDHDYYAGRDWDQYLCAIYRSGLTDVRL